MKRVMPVVLWSLLSVLLMAMATLVGCAGMASAGKYDNLHESEHPSREAGVAKVEPSDFYDFTHGFSNSESARASGSPAVQLPSPLSVVGTPQDSRGLSDLLTGNSQMPPSGDANAKPVPVATLSELITTRADEIWIIPRSSRTRAVSVQTRGTGTIVVVNLNEPVDSWPSWPRLPTVATDVHAEITGLLAAVTVQQRFTNSNSYPIEAAYAFPLPDDAAVSDFVMTIGDRRIRGIVREREEARQIYDAAKAQGVNAALLEQERPNIFLQRVANIAAGATIAVDITYYNTLPCIEGWCELVLPTTIGPRYTPQGQTPPAADRQIGIVPTVTVGVDIDAGVDLGKVESPSHRIDLVRPSRWQAFARMQSRNARHDGDFVLRWKIARESATGVVYTTQAGGSGYFAMQLVPPESRRSGWVRPLDVVFVLDRSGSMSGWPLTTAKRAIMTGIDGLRGTERFQIVDFSESTAGLGSRMLPPTRENRAAAERYLDATPAGGGTEMKQGLAAALAIPEEPGRMKVIVFLTDGFIGNEPDVLSLVDKGIGNAKIFSFGIGNNPNRFLINELAAVGDGVSSWARNPGDGVEAMEDFLDTIRSPVLTDIRLSFAGSEARIDNVSLPRELYAGRTVFITGRCAGPMSGSVVVSAREKGRHVSFEIPVRAVNANAATILPKLWARGEIASLARRQLRGQDVDAVSASRNLALEHGLVSPYTSFIAVDAAGAMK